ncbi:MAG: FtsB family cell division protein [Spirochaetales bacterium]
MTRKLLILFIVLTLCFYSLIVTFFGERGIIANNQLRRQLKENEYELDRREVELENLERQRQELSTEDGLRSAAMNLGYQVESDDVYVFSAETAQETGHSSQQNNASEKSQSSFKPFSTLMCLLISIGLSIIITFVIWLIGKGKGKENDSKQEESGDIGNNLGLD